MNTIILLILTILFAMMIFIYFVDLLITLTMLPNMFETKQDFLNKLIPFRFWKGKIKLFKNYNNLPSAKEK